MPGQVTTTALANARALARELRNGKSISFCDTIVSFEDGKVVASSMGYDGESHVFGNVRLSFASIRNTLTSGVFR